ncbi:amino acid adenylation domain-containing protein [Nonomuraea sp. NPDC050663]|uniref:amino acid adenylation domain-containing protein n=1 Tax=Nonomuraea sp. NPDC050663 TaxID=3364370 RepID=UPI0037BD09D3
MRQAEDRPHAVAVSGDGGPLTYTELDERARSCRSQLERLGVAPGSLVALCVGRNVNLAVATLAVAGLGCAYVPIDPRYPDERRRYVLEDARPAALIREDPKTGEPVASCLEHEPRTDVPPDAAYVIYTSGTTGPPKGTLVGHANLLALFDACQEHFAFTGDEVWTVFHSYGFDFSVWELWGALLHGGRAVVVSSADAANPWRLARLLREESVTVLSQVPTAFGYLVNALEDVPIQLERLRWIVFGGEAVNLTDVRRWTALGLAPNARPINMYGITETTVHVTHHVIDLDQVPYGAGSTPIGRPLSHLEVRVVDEALREVPSGVPGEMLVGGAGVAHGYLGRPGLTADRFVHVDGLGRCYRSGDWAVRDASGGLHYLGRQDRQVKVRGHRIELGEVEAAIAEHPDVHQCVADVRGGGQAPELVAHYAGRSSLNPEELKQYLAQRLPAHLVPSRLHWHARLPQTGNGKIDRARLSADLERS